MAIHPETLTKQKIYFIGLTPLGMLPLMRYIVPLFKGRQVTVVTIHIQQSYRFEDVSIQRDVLTYSDTKAFNANTYSNKLRKYVGFVTQIFLNILRGENSIIYTVDF